MRLLILTRAHTRHDARWLRLLGDHGLTLGFLPLLPVDPDRFGRMHPNVTLLDSAWLPVDASTEQLIAAESRVAETCERWAPDVMLAGPLTDAGFLATRICPGRTLLMSWAFDVLHEPRVVPGARGRLLATLRLGRHLFTDCQAIAAECRRLAGHDFVNGCVLPWGLTQEDTPNARTGWRQRLGDEAAKVIFYGRGFERVHQPLVIVEAFRRAHAQDPRLRLWLAGEGPLRTETQTAVNQAGLPGVVRLLGQLDQHDLAGCLAEADAYVACSLSDGTSLTLLQAMHAGLPCIAADLPGNREWLDAGDGWLVPTDQPEALAAALVATMSLSGFERHRRATALRARVARDANLRDNLPRLLATMQSIANKAAADVPRFDPAVFATVSACPLP